MIAYCKNACTVSWFWKKMSPFSFAHLWILLRYFCIFLSMMMFRHWQKIEKSSTETVSISVLNSLIVLLIFNMNIGLGRTQFGYCLSKADPEYPKFLKISNEYDYASFYVLVVHVTHYSVFPSIVKCILQIEENRHDMLASNKDVAYKCLEADKLVGDILVISASTLHFIFSKKHVRWMLTIISIVLYIQLVSDLES